MNHAAKQRGFTLVELMLAMAFISILLLAIVTTVIQLSQVYNRGLTFKEVNQAGRSVSDDLQRTFASAQAFSIADGTGHYVNANWGGRLCTGQYSYIWNYGKALNESNPELYTYTIGNDRINLVRVPDSGGNYCSGQAAYKKINQAVATELLQGGDHDLAVHQLTASSADRSYDAQTGQRLYTVLLTIGTNDIAALTDDQLACKAPGDDGADLTYCVVQQFRIVLRAGSASL